MEVKIQKVFPIAARAEAAWKVLTDIRAVASCMPGAAITDQLADRKYKGNVKVKVGPASAAFDGEIEVLGLDANSMEMRLLGKGQDSKGSSGASMELTARIVPVDAHNCELRGDSVVAVTGKFANFGGRMMEQVSEQILKQFAANFGNRAIMAQGDLGDPTVDKKAVAEAAARVAEQSKELSALSFLFALIKGWFLRLFRPA
ncbi:MAG: SRPBCC family protein [Pseudomonadota bacterium]|jgi:carbon monoxide dehydrogenase subunit G